MYNIHTDFKINLRNYLSLLIFLLFLLNCFDNKEYAKVEINGKVFNFEVANTSQLREKGLMFRKKLAKDGGMIFVWGYEDLRFFYMKNTIIPLDIAFINANLEIVSIKSMEPLDETTVPSDEPAMYAIEVNRGFFNRHNIKVGDKIKLLTSLKYY